MNTIKNISYVIDQSVDPEVVFESNVVTTIIPPNHTTIYYNNGYVPTNCYCKPMCNPVCKMFYCLKKLFCCKQTCNNNCFNFSNVSSSNNCNGCTNNIN